MSDADKKILEAVMVMLEHTLGSMSATEADTVVRGCTVIIRNLLAK